MIYGPLVPIIQGETTRRRPKHYAQVTQVLILSPVIHKQPIDSNITTLLFIERLPYILMKSYVYQLHGLNCCRGREKIENRSAIKKQINKFGVRYICITSVHAYNDFEKVRDILRPIHFEISARGEQV